MIRSSALAGRFKEQLTDAEAALLMSVARQHVSANADLEQRASATSARQRELCRQGKQPPPGEMTALQKEREELVFKHIDLLRKGLGDLRFKHLHEYVLRRWGPGIHDLPPRGSGKK